MFGDGWKSSLFPIGNTSYKVLWLHWFLMGVVSLEFLFHRQAFQTGNETAAMQVRFFG